MNGHDGELETEEEDKVNEESLYGQQRDISTFVVFLLSSGCTGFIIIIIIKIIVYGHSVSQIGYLSPRWVERRRFYSIEFSH